MIRSRRPYHRPYFFEVFSVAQIILVYAVIVLHGPNILGMVNANMAVTLLAMLLATVAGLIFRFGAAAYRGKARVLWRAIANGGWLTDTLRLMVGNALLIGVYGSIKLVLPIYHPLLYDRQLWEIDSAMFGGYSPVVFVLSVFSNPGSLRFFDFAYANIFFFSLQFSFMYFLSHPSRRIRMAYADGSMALWCLGAWLYLLVPSLGPAYVFPDVWLAYRDALPETNRFHRLLIMNYQGVLDLKAGISAPLTFFYGVAAFPSLHVALQTFIFVWMRRLWISAQVLFGIFTLLILLGSMITGWHYLIDGLAGMVMAVGCYAVPARLWGVHQWARHCAATGR